MSRAVAISWALLILVSLVSADRMDGDLTAPTELTKAILPEVTVVQHRMMETIRNADDAEIINWFGNFQIADEWIRATIINIRHMLADSTATSHQWIFNLETGEESSLSLDVGICKATKNSDGEIEIVGEYGFFGIKIPDIVEWYKYAESSRRWGFAGPRENQHTTRIRPLKMEEFLIVKQAVLDKAKEVYKLSMPAQQTA